MNANSGEADIPVKLSGATKRGDAKSLIARAFAEQAIANRYSAIRTGDVIRQAGVGRSTFYEHFRGKDDVLMLVIAPMLDHLANAASKRLSRAAAIGLFRHLWDQRAVARNLLTGSAASRVQRELAIRIGQRRRWTTDAERPPMLAATAIAAGQLAFIETWLSGHSGEPIEQAVDQFLAFSVQGFAACHA